MSRKKFLDLDLSGIPVLPFWRPDSVYILSDRDAIYRFNRYWRILSGRTIAKFLISKKILVDSYDPEDISSMWDVHRIYMEEFWERLELDDSQLVSWWKNASFPEENLLKLKRDLAYAILKSCRFCEFKCGVNRLRGELGVCRVDSKSRIASMFVHVGEEAELVPSFTIFFSGCNFRCQYCQNWDISQVISGVYIDPKNVAKEIQKRWCNREIRNVNWVGGSPTPNLHYILDVLLNLDSNVPQIWNSNFYNSVEAINLLLGMIDLWLPDFKYGNNNCALRLSKVPRYFDVITRNFKIINSFDEEILIRHLVLPNHLYCCTKPILKWIKNNLDLSSVRINVMAQYRPEYQAHKYPEISRSLKPEEFEEAISYAKELGLPLTL